jgi:hypothetical protein
MKNKKYPSVGIILKSSNIKIVERDKNTQIGFASGTKSAHPSGGSPPVFSGVCVTRALVLCVCFVDRSLSFVLFLLAIV